MAIIQAKDFNNRKDLEKYILAEKAVKILDKIEGTREELAKLRLSDKNSVYGVICVITDTPTKDHRGKKAAQITKNKKQ